MRTVAAFCLLAGAILALLAAIGMFRFGDVFSRMHAATKPVTLGLILVLVGAAFFMPRPDPIVKLALVVLLQFITAPVGAHLIGRAAFRDGADLVEGTTVDPRSQALRPPGGDSQDSTGI